MRVCPKKKQRNGPPKDSLVEVLKEEGNSKSANLSYAWGKVRELDALILFDPIYTHNFISHELALKLGILTLKCVMLSKPMVPSKGKSFQLLPS